MYLQILISIHYTSLEHIIHNIMANNSWNLLDVYYVLGTMPNANYELFHVIFTTAP